MLDINEIMNRAKAATERASQQIKEMTERTKESSEEAEKRAAEDKQRQEEREAARARYEAEQAAANQQKQQAVLAQMMGAEFAKQNSEMDAKIAEEVKKQVAEMANMSAQDLIGKIYGDDMAMLSAAFDTLEELQGAQEDFDWNEEEMTSEQLYGFVEEKMREIADEVGAYLLADIAHIAGLVVTGLHPSPAPYADFVTTTTHKSLRGPRGGITMCREEHAAGIDKAIFPGMQGGPLEHIIAAKAVALHEAMQPEFKTYAEQIIKNAKALAQGLMDEGMDIVGGMTENHLMTLDLRRTGKTGKDMANVLERVGITANKNTVPNDPQSPFVTSGIRLGTPAVTTRGFKEDDMTEVAKIIASAIFASDNEQGLKNLRERSLKLCKKYPLYQ